VNKFSIAVILFFTLLLSFTSGVKAEMCSCECICSSCQATVYTSYPASCTMECMTACFNNPMCGGYVGVSYDGCSGSDDPTTTTTAEPNTTTTKNGGLCTSELIYGEDSEEVEILRYIRDNVLNQTPTGQELIRLYYQWSPAIVKTMENDEDFKEDIKELIDGVLGLIVETE